MPKVRHRNPVHARARTVSNSTPSPPAMTGNGHSPAAASGENSRSDLSGKFRELLRLAKEQGHLTYHDVNEALGNGSVTPDELDEVHSKLRNLEIEIIDPAEVETGKSSNADDAEEPSRHDLLDDPVRMYMKQMGKVPL